MKYSSIFFPHLILPFILFYSKLICLFIFHLLFINLLNYGYYFLQSKYPFTFFPPLLYPSYLYPLLIYRSIFYPLSNLFYLASLAICSHTSVNLLDYLLFYVNLFIYILAFNFGCNFQLSFILCSWIYLDLSPGGAQMPIAPTILGNPAAWNTPNIALDTIPTYRFNLNITRVISFIKGKKEINKTLLKPQQLLLLKKWKDLVRCLRFTSK